MRFTAWALTAFLFVAGAASASDDITIVSKNKTNGKPAGNSTQYFSSDHVRMDDARGSGMIIESKTGTMTTVDNMKKTYYTTTKKDTEEFNAKMQEKMNSPEGKQGMEFMKKMAAGMATSVEVKKTGKTRKVGPYTCEEWEIKQTAFSTMKECVTGEVEFPEHATKGLTTFLEGMKGASPFAPVAKAGESMADKMKVIKGFPVATSTSLDIMGNKQTTETEVIEIKRDSIPASTWEVPAGYKQIENPMKKALEHHG